MAEKTKNPSEEQRRNRIVREITELALRSLEKNGESRQVRQAYLDGLRDGFCLSHGPEQRLKATEKVSTNEKRENSVVREITELALRRLDKQGHGERGRQAYLDGLRDGFSMSRAPKNKLVELFGERVSQSQGKPLWRMEK